MNVWQTRHRLLSEQLDNVAARLRRKQDTEPQVIEDHVVRLLTAAVLLLRQHRFDTRGQCGVCGCSLRRLRLWQTRPRCTVFPAVDLAMRQSIDVVWWQLCTADGRDVTLTEIRDWLHLPDRYTS